MSAAGWPAPSAMIALRVSLAWLSLASISYMASLRRLLDPNDSIFSNQGAVRSCRASP